MTKDEKAKQCVLKSINTLFKNEAFASVFEGINVVTRQELVRDLCESIRDFFEDDKQTPQGDGELTDDSIMTFGKKYTGRKLMDVPADYFHWMYHEAGFKGHDSPLARYIQRNINAFKEENPNLIW